MSMCGDNPIVSGEKITTTLCAHRKNKQCIHMILSSSQCNYSLFIENSLFWPIIDSQFNQN